MERSKNFYDYFLCLAKISVGELSREEVFYCFESIALKLLVALEKHSDDDKIHFHICLRTQNNVSFINKIFYSIAIEESLIVVK